MRRLAPWSVLVVLACGPAPKTGPQCGTCPTGYVCGTANGAPVCRAPSGIPLFGHVFIIMMENTSWSTLDGSGNTPYLHGLKATAAYSTNYHGVAHPSLLNYIALTSGGTQGLGCDCQPTGSKCNGLNCNALTGSCGCPVSVRNIADDLEAASVTWRAYAENSGSACNLTTSGSYAARHVPFLYYDDIQTDSGRCTSHVVDYSNLTGDLAAKTPQYSFIAPNLTDDMHDPFPAGSQNLANGDTWLSTQVPIIQASGAYQAGGVIFIVWDEDDYSGALSPDDPVPMYVLSPFVKQAGYVSTTHADHYSLLATIEDGLGLPRLGSAASAQPLADFFSN